MKPPRNMDHSKSNFREALGISQERADLLLQRMNSKIEDFNTKSEAIEHAIFLAKNAQELAFIVAGAVDGFRHIEFDHECDSVYAALGIPDERAEYLYESMCLTISQGQIPSLVMEYITEKCNNLAEMLYLSFMLGKSLKSKK